MVVGKPWNLFPQFTSKTFSGKQAFDIAVVFIPKHLASVYQFCIYALYGNSQCFWNFASCEIKNWCADNLNSRNLHCTPPIGSLDCCISVKIACELFWKAGNELPKIWVLLSSYMLPLLRNLEIVQLKMANGKTFLLKFLQTACSSVFWWNMSHLSHNNES